MSWRSWQIFLMLLVLGSSGASLASVFYVSTIMAASGDRDNDTYKREKLTCMEGAEIHRDQCVSVCQFGALGVFSSERECQSGQLSWVGGACVGTFALALWLFVILKVTARKNIKYDE